MVWGSSAKLSKQKGSCLTQICCTTLVRTGHLNALLGIWDAKNCGLVTLLPRGGWFTGFADAYTWITCPLQLGAPPMLAPSMKVKLKGRSLKLKAPQFFRGAKPARSNLKQVTKSTVNQLPPSFSTAWWMMANSWSFPPSPNKNLGEVGCWSWISRGISGCVLNIFPLDLDMPFLKGI